MPELTPASVHYYRDGEHLCCPKSEPAPGDFRVLAIGPPHFWQADA